MPPGYVGESDYQERADAAFACAFRLRRRGDDDDPLLRSLPQRIRALFDNERGHVLDGRYTSGMVAELNDIELTMLYGSDKPDCALKVWLIDRL